MLVVATHNVHKLREISQIIPGWEIISDSPDVEETEKTFAGNARLKAIAIAKRHPGAWIMADDSGLCVDALNGEPGVYSARYAGRDGDTPANNALLLKNLEGVVNRSAHFTCAIALISPDGEVHDMEGRVYGHIAEKPSGAAGFGYDPLFIPDGFNKSFAELAPEEKNAISHRGRALKEVEKFLKSLLTFAPGYGTIRTAFKQ